MKKFCVCGGNDATRAAPPCAHARALTTAAPRRASTSCEMSSKPSFKLYLLPHEVLPNLLPVGPLNPILSDSDLSDIPQVLVTHCDLTPWMNMMKQLMVKDHLTHVLMVNLVLQSRSSQSSQSLTRLQACNPSWPSSCNSNSSCNNRCS